MDSNPLLNSYRHNGHQVVHISFSQGFCSHSCVAPSYKLEHFFWFEIFIPEVCACVLGGVLRGRKLMDLAELLKL